MADAGRHEALHQDNEVPTCRDFMRFGRCEYGEDCNFSHEEPKVVLRTFPEDSRAQALYDDWQLLLDSAREGTSGKRLWPKALEILDTGDRETQQKLIADLVDDKALHAVLSTVSPPNGQDSIVRKEFLQIITHRELLDCLSVDTHVGTLYNFLSGSHGTRAIPWLIQLCADVEATDPRPAHDGRYANTKEETTAMILKSLYELLRRERRFAFNDDLPVLFERLQSLVQGMSSSDLSNRVVAMKQTLESAASNVTQSLPDLISRSSAIHRSRYPRDVDRPGGRHDNDHAVLSHIKIFPTTSEITSKRPEYLPSTNLTEDHFLPNPVQRFIDTQFRLFRQNIFGPVKGDLAKMIKALQDGTAENDLVSLGGQARKYVYANASVRDIKFSPKHGLELHFSFDLPKVLGRKKAWNREMLWDILEEQQTWWQDSPRLGEGGLVCFITHDEDCIRPILLTVSHKNLRIEKKGVNRGGRNAPILTHLVSEENRPSIALTPAVLGPDDFRALVRLYTKKTSGVLVDFPSIIPGTFVDILGNLQRMKSSGDVAFHHRILPIAGVQQAHDRSTPEESVPPPAYARRAGFTFNLNSISTQNIPRVDPLNPEDVDLNLIEEATGLDGGQASALVHGLTNEFALIQGPPGTGKSFVGVKLVKVLLANKSLANIGPIVIICYTNHALDQFLKHLLNDGIKRIIRIGGRSRASELEPHNLLTICRSSPRTDKELSSIGGNYGRMERCSLDAAPHLELLRHMRKGEPPLWSDLKTFLHENYLEIFEQLQASSRQGNFVRGRDPLTIWLEGTNAPTNGTPEPHQPRQDVNIREVVEQAKSDIHSLSLGSRATLVDHWVCEKASPHADKLLLLAKGAKKCQEENQATHGEINRRELLKADVVGVTTTGLAKHIEVLKRLGSKVVICEEAGEVMEPHIVSAMMPRVEHFIQIGDHKQLRPLPQDDSLRGGRYKLDRSQFERRAEGEPGMRPLPVAQLNIQRRMRPDMSKLIHSIYPSLQDHERVQNLPDVVGARRNVFWLDHRNHEDTAPDCHHTKSHSNTWEVSMTQAIVQHFVRQGVYGPDDIAVLTPYRRQLQRLITSFSKDYNIFLSDRDEEDLAASDHQTRHNRKGASPSKDTPDELPEKYEKRTLTKSLRLATVDNFQGEEAKIVIISLVRSNEIQRPGFLKTENRINVLVSRAQHGMFLIGNSQTYSSVPMWKDIQNQLLDADALGPALPLCCPRHPETDIQCATPEDFSRHAPDGGCSLPCDKRLTACGHRCLAKCHAEAMHEAYYCLQSCVRVRTTCSHACRKVCGDDCGPCKVKVHAELACGHFAKVECAQLQDLGSVSPVTWTQARSLSHAPSHAGRCFVAGTSAQEPADLASNKIAIPLVPRSAAEDTMPAITLAHSFATMVRTVAPARMHVKSSARTRNVTTSAASPALLASKCAHGLARTRDHATCLAQHLATAFPATNDATGYWHVAISVLVSVGRVDLVELRTYSMIELDQTPIVVLGCGHFFTAESLDGLVGLDAVYTKNPETGAFSGLKDIMYGQMVENPPCCPDCKCPIRQFATKRYNRAINRAIMDETSKRFHLKGMQKLELLRNRLKQLDENLESTRKDQPTVADSRFDQYQFLRLAIPYRLRPIGQLETDIRTIRITTVESYQPVTQLFNAIAHRNEVTSLEDRLNNMHATSGANGQTCQPSSSQLIPLKARLLELQVQGCYLRDTLAIVRKGHPPSITVSTTLRSANQCCTCPHEFLTNCHSFIKQAEELHLPLLAINAITCYASVACWCKFFEAAKTTEATADDGARTREHYYETAKELLERALDMADGLENRLEIWDLIEKLQEAMPERYEEVSAEEVASIKLAMVSGAEGMATNSGHWYNCINGHPFAIGDCGMPMEEALCPECGARIGGTNHFAVQGVTRAIEME
ncbi:NFX1-type zinc finger-containing protein 1 [Paramyrothecium foliicola]|nr:NFX1-type zinc finger-containing protein 1 [Paramyrothecium foliicola]